MDFEVLWKNTEYTSSLAAKIQVACFRLIPPILAEAQASLDRDSRHGHKNLYTASSEMVLG